MANDTMVHGSVTYNVWYVDPSGTNGNGLTPATSFNVLPQPASIPESACYIIRRNSSAVTMTFAGQTRATKYLIIMGMPLSTDEIYQEVPTAVKTAWDGDSGAVLYAQIKLTADASMVITNNWQFLLHRIHIYRNTGVNSATSYMFNFTVANSRWNNNIKVDYCKFTTMGYDLSSAGYNTVIPQNYMYCYIWCDSNGDQNGCNSFSVTNSVICAGPASTSWYCCFGSRGARNVNISNNQIHTTGCHIYPVMFYFGLANNYVYEHFESAIYDNNTITLWVNGNGSYSGQFSSLFYSARSNYLSMRNWTITDSPTVLGGTGLRPSRIFFWGPLIKFDDLRSFDIKNITANITQWSEVGGEYYVQTMYTGTWDDASRVYGGCVLCFAGAASACLESYVRNISDITLNFPDTPTVLPDASNPTWSTFNAYTYMIYYASMVVDFSYGDDAVYAHSWNSVFATYYPMSLSARQPVKLTNVVVNNWRGRALGLSGVTAVLGDIKGQIALSNGSVVTVNSISTWFPGAALLLRPDYATAGCIAQVGTLTVNKSNATYPYVAQLAVSFGTDNVGIGNPYSPRCNMVYIGTSNAPTASNIGASYASTNNREYPNRFACVCANELAAGNGNWMMRTLNYVVNTWSTFRTGGAAASLKMYQNACATWTDWMFIGQDPYSAMTVTPAQTGKKYIRMYLAFKGYGDPANLFNNVQFIVKYKNSNGNGSCDYRYSGNDGVWKVDGGSVWNGDTGLTQYVCQIHVNIQTLDPIDVKMGFNWYSASGYLYVDPLPVISDTLL